MGGFIEFDDSDPLCLDNFIRIKVWINIENPLTRGTRITVNPNYLKWVDTKYESMREFCFFFCGTFGCFDKDCDD
ncbi:DNA polymerase II [Bienertia sinuspersici]